jgi:hypothetical protein
MNGDFLSSFCLVLNSFGEWPKVQTEHVTSIWYIEIRIM